MTGLPAYAPPLISSPSRKRELLAEAGVEELVVQPFDRAFAGTEPDRFVELRANQFHGALDPLIERCHRCRTRCREFCNHGTRADDDF